uniref:universal stress protein n=1 Tax=Pedobacter schmidteae TaxID=2201271 RepID=UPI000EB04868|nr:universal stress protein [Pedobacter schmidteae]
MKKILVPTDFSVPAENAARYALALAKELKADVLICNAFKVPAEAPMASRVAWPLMNYAELKQEATSELDSLVKSLSNSFCSQEGEYCPNLTYESSLGSVWEVVSMLVEKEKIDLVVMGGAGAGGLTQLLLGSNSREMIERANFPLLLIPFEAGFKKVKKIVFASDLSKDELEPLKVLSGFASQLGSRMVIAHITNKEVDPDGKQQDEINVFFQDVIAKINIPDIQYEYIWNIDIDNGLDWLSEEKDVDMIVLTHHRHHALYRMFVGSHTQKLSRHTKIPLLMFPIHSKSK